MNTSDNNYLIALANTLGHAVLIETLRSAAYYVSHSNGSYRESKTVSRIREGSSCYLFIQGTGLEMIIQDYNLNYDADRLREGFFTCLKQNIQVSQ